MLIIAVLDDDQRRISAIQAAARQNFSDYELRIFRSAREMIAWLVCSPRNVSLLSLDSDLDSCVFGDAACGTGEDVTEFLAYNLPKYPVLIHSSNAMSAPAMHMELALASCKRAKLCPFQDSDSWATDVQCQLDAE